MIKSIHIENFQSHKNTTLTLSDGVNVVIGSSDSGKTAIIRALNWLVNNKPAGEDFRSSWGGDTTVDIILNKDMCVSRERTKENLYIISSNKGVMAQEFKSFGQDVPQEIKQLLNFSDINIQYQLDSPFLLSATAGEVGRYLNKIVSLDKIDSTLSNIEKRRRKIKSEIEMFKGQLSQQNEELKKYDDLDEIEEKIKQIEKLSNECSYLSKQQQELNVIITTIGMCDTDIRQLKDKTQYANMVNDLLNESEQIAKIETESNKLKSIITELIDNEERIEFLNKQIEPEIMVRNLLIQIEEINEIETTVHELKVHLDIMIETGSTIMAIIKNKEKLQSEYNGLMPDVCPLCGRSG